MNLLHQQKMNGAYLLFKMSSKINRLQMSKRTSSMIKKQLPRAMNQDTLMFQRKNHSLN